MKPKVIRFKFEGRKSTVLVTYDGPATFVNIVIGDESLAIRASQVGQRLYFGHSVCNPSDTYDAAIGIKVACARACTVGDPFYRMFADGRERRVYSAIRARLRELNWKPANA